MATAAKCLEIVERPRIAPSLQRDNVISFQPTGPAALDTAPAVALEHGAAYCIPAERIQVDVVSAHLFLCEIKSSKRPLGSVRYSPIRIRTMCVELGVRTVKEITYTLHNILNV